MSNESKLPFPPFDQSTAAQKVRMAEDAWNSKDPEKVSLAYTSDSQWRNRSDFISGRQEIVAFLEQKWQKEYGNENWEFSETGHMKRRVASINDLPIIESERKFHWPLGRRPDDHSSLSELGL